MIIMRAPDTPESFQTLVRLRREAAAWLESQGLDQWVNDWPDTETMLAGFARDLASGATWFAVDNGAVLGAITINEATDPGLWTAEEQRSALFVHRLTVDRRARGRGVGARLLDLAGQQAVSQGREWVRLDAWTTNRKLHAYYMRHGFRLVRIVRDHPTPSAACFERPADYATDRPIAIGASRSNVPTNPEIT